MFCFKSSSIFTLSIVGYKVLFIMEKLVALFERFSFKSNCSLVSFSLAKFVSRGVPEKELFITDLSTFKSIFVLFSFIAPTIVLSVVVNELSVIFCLRITVAFISFNSSSKLTPSG